MYCKNCGSELTENAKFCQYCGTAIANEQPHSVYQSQPTTDTKNDSLPICGLGVAGFIVSIAALLMDILLLASITGTVLSSIALYQIKTQRKGGKGLAIAGLVIGIIAVIINARLLLINFALYA